MQKQKQNIITKKSHETEEPLIVNQNEYVLNWKNEIFPKCTFFPREHEIIARSLART